MRSILLAAQAAPDISFLSVDTWIGVAGTIAVFTILYLLSPALRAKLKGKLKKQDSEDEENKEFRAWFMERADKLEVAREEQYKRIADENARLSERVAALEGDAKKRSVIIEDLERKIRTLQWLYLSEVCDALAMKIDERANAIADEFIRNGEEVLAESVRREFKRVIEEIRQNFIVQQLEKDAHDLGSSGDPMSRLTFDSLQDRLEEQIRGKREKIRSQYLDHLPADIRDDVD